MLTARALLFGFVGFCFYLIAFVNSLPTFYYALTWLAAGVLASCLGTAILSLFGLHCDWTVESAVVAEAPERTERRVISFFVDEDDEDQLWDESLIEWDSSGHAGLHVTLTNRGTFNKTDLILETQLHEITRGERLVRSFLIEALPSGAQIAATLPLHDLQRGRYRVVSVLLRGSDVLGLFRFRKKIPAQHQNRSSQSSAAPTPNASGQNGAESETAAQIVVGPAMLGLEDVSGRGLAGAVSGAAGGRRSPGRGDEFSGTRPYVVGDDLRLVHWKSTARRGEFVVREWERTTQDQTLVIWDGAAPTARERVHQRRILRALQLGPIGAQFKLLKRWEEKRLAAHHQSNTDETDTNDESETARAVDEWALRLTASLCRILSESGRSCGLLRLDTKPYLLPPTRSAASTQFLARVQEILSSAHAMRSSTLPAALVAALRTSHSGHTYLVTASTSPDLIDAVRWLQRRNASVVVCLVDGAVFDGSATKHKGRPRRDVYVEQEERLQNVGINVLRLPQPPALVRSHLLFRVDDDGIPGGAQQMQMLQDALRELMQLQNTSHGRAVQSEKVPGEKSLI